jgi:hypothetical protein
VSRPLSLVALRLHMLRARFQTRDLGTLIQILQGRRARYEIESCGGRDRKLNERQRAFPPPMACAFSLNSKSRMQACWSVVSTHLANGFPAGQGIQLHDGGRTNDAARTEESRTPRRGERLCHTFE